MRLISFFLLPFIFITQVFAADCRNEAEMKMKLMQLKSEVACAQQSMHACQKILSGSRHSQELYSAQEQQCLGDNDFLIPVSLATTTLAKQVNKSLAAHNGKFVISVEEFYEHTRLHRERVKVLGLELYKTHPELFRGLREHQVLGILEAHDKAKMTAGSLSPDGRPFYRTLYSEGYGKRLDRSVVDALNAKDKQYMEKALQEYGLKNNPELRAKMERIEKIADFVDRGMSPVSPEEFGRPMDKASTFMNNEADKKLALELEKKYKNLTSHLEYRELGPFQKKALTHHLSVEEKFSEARRVSGNSTKLSARVMSHRLMVSGTKSIAKFLEMLASKGVSKALMILDFPMLYFASMDSIGCSGLGYHDWVKDPNCSPAIGLTPKIINFLNEDWEKQKLSLNDGTKTCKVIQGTHKESMTAPKVLSCSQKDIMMELQSGDKIKLSLNGKKEIQNIQLRDLADHAPGIGRAETVAIGSDGNVSEVCYMLYHRGGPMKKCYDGKSPAGLKMNDFMRTINYQIQKGVACCLKSNSDLKCR